jgi:hypothetical protein
MRYSSAVLFAALMVSGSMSPVFACRGAKNATIIKPSIDRFVSTGLDQYNVKIDAGEFTNVGLVAGPSHDFGFCVDVSVLESSDLQDTITGAMFWSADGDPINAYFLYIRNGQYRIGHQLFGKVYELVPWTTDASIKTGLRQKNEVDVRVTAMGADIQINGSDIPGVFARPFADAQYYYGVVFKAPKAGTGSFQVGSPRIVK